MPFARRTVESSLQRPPRIRFRGILQHPISLGIGVRATETAKFAIMSGNMDYTADPFASQALPDFDPLVHDEATNTVLILLHFTNVAPNTIIDVVRHEHRLTLSLPTVATLGLVLREGRTAAARRVVILLPLSPEVAMVRNMLHSLALRVARAAARGANLARAEAEEARRQANRQLEAAEVVRNQAFQLFNDVNRSGALLTQAWNDHGVEPEAGIDGVVPAPGPGPPVNSPVNGVDEARPGSFFHSPPPDLIRESANVQTLVARSPPPRSAIDEDHDPVLYPRSPSPPPERNGQYGTGPIQDMNGVSGAEENGFEAFGTPFDVLGNQAAQYVAESVLQDESSQPYYPADVDLTDPTAPMPPIGYVPPANFLDDTYDESRLIGVADIPDGLEPGEIFEPASPGASPGVPLIDGFLFPEGAHTPGGALTNGFHGPSADLNNGSRTPGGGLANGYARPDRLSDSVPPSGTSDQHSWR